MKIINKITIIFLIILFFGVNLHTTDYITIGIIKYRGGDWYECKNGIKNFLYQVKNRLNYPIKTEPPILKLTDDKLFQYPIILINGHGQILLNNDEKEKLKKYLNGGGFLIVNDDYGLDKHFRKLVKDMYSNKKLVKLPNSHKIFSCYYKFHKGLPKIHKHDDEAAKAYGLFINKRLSILYLYSSDIVDGWEKKEVHKDDLKTREKAYKMGVNILWYAMSH